MFLTSTQKRGSNLFFTCFYPCHFFQIQNHNFQAHSFKNLSGKIELENTRSLLNKISFYNRSKVPHFQSNFAIKMILNINFFSTRKETQWLPPWLKKKKPEKNMKKKPSTCCLTSYPANYLSFFINTPTSFAG